MMSTLFPEKVLSGAEGKLVGAKQGFTGIVGCRVQGDPSPVRIEMIPRAWRSLVF
jgi:hypothetical protein